MSFHIKFSNSIYKRDIINNFAFSKLCSFHVPEIILLQASKGYKITSTS